jgi:RNA polymerase sigma-70 factor (ECF subfamily)
MLQSAISWLESDSFVASHINRKASGIARSRGFSRSDKDDLEQELRLQVWLRQQEHDRSRTSFNTYARKVVENRAISLVRAKRAAKRGAGARHHSLSASGAEYEDTAIPGSADSDLRLDIQTALAKAPTELQELAAALSEHSIHRAGKKLGRSRRIIQSQLVCLKRIFEQAELQAYVPGAGQRRS